MKKALSFCTLAADAGHAEAQLHLGVMYEHGEGTNIDKEAALKWYTTSAKSGNSTAAYYAYEMLSKRLLEGDQSRAEVMLLRAVELGQKSALMNLAMQYATGEGRPGVVLGPLMRVSVTKRAGELRRI
jgi:TPR repeat protein